MLHHQTWFAEEALRNRVLITPPPTSKDFSLRFNPLSELLSKEYQHNANQMHVNTADLLIRSSTPNLSRDTDLKQTQQQQPRSMTQQHQYKPQQPFNIRYPSPAAFFRHQHQQQQLPHSSQKLSKVTNLSSSSHHTASATQNKSSETSKTSRPEYDTCSNNVIELTTTTIQHDEAAALRDRDSGNSSAATTSSITSPMLYKESLEQLLQRRRSHSSLGGEAQLKTYSQILLNAVTDPSNCKEKSSSSSTSSTPPLTLMTPGQHSLNSHQMLKSPSDSSSLFSEAIEEETRCVVCNAHFPNVWLLEQHAALQHPILGPGEEKPFICEQCGQSYRYRSAYAKHKEQNHRARLPADKLFTCDVCGMQFRYLKSFKKHRLNHALERLHGKKGSAKHQLAGSIFAAHFHHLQEHEMITSTQELMLAEPEAGEDLRINIKKEKDEEDEQQQHQEELFQKPNEERETSVNAVEYMQQNVIKHAAAAADMNINNSEEIHSTNKRPHTRNTPLPVHFENDPAYHPHHHHHQLLTAQHHPTPYTLPQQALHHLAARIPGHLPHNLASTAAAGTISQHQPHILAQTAQQATATVAAAAAASTSLNSLSSLNSISSLINSERMPNDQFLGLNPQEASILNFLRADAVERQRDKRPPASRFACPFCGKCVRSKENLKLHVRKHTGERPFVCLFCGRAFGGKSDLTRHLRIHTGERPYHCESCGKCFARADYLSKHLTTHIHNAPR